MAAQSGGTTVAVRGLLKQLYAEPYEFDFFQAVRLLERVFRKKRPVGLGSVPEEEVVRFRSHLSLSFPASSLYELLPENNERPMPLLTVTFMGLTGPSGVLPTHYTQLLMDLSRDLRGPERRSLRDWFDLFNHRYISLYYRAWEKYRFFLTYERGEPFRAEPDTFTQALLSIVGQGLPKLRDRMRVYVPNDSEHEDAPPQKVFAKIDDLALLYYSGIISQRPRNVTNLQILLSDYFDLPITIEQFQGQWLAIDPANQCCLGSFGMLGINSVAGERVWDVQSRFRVRVGPLDYFRFQEFLPDRSPSPLRKSLFLLNHLIRQFVGPEFDFDVQLVLMRKSVPQVQLNEVGLGPRLGWNMWLISETPKQDVEDAVFEGEIVTLLA